MRLRNLFMILLLCMTVGVFSVACTGDDGAQGPPGPAGPQGPPGDAADGGDGGEVAEDTDFYPFLESWGVMDGEVGCNSEVLTGMGPLPGPAMVLPKPEATETFKVEVACGDGFDDVDADPTIANLGTPTPDTGSIIFLKTGRSKTDLVGENTDEEATTYSLASRTNTKKNFLEGTFHAKLTEDGTGESLERELLYRECGEGAEPPSILGTWRAAQIIASKQEYENSKPVEGTDGNPVAAEVTTTTKVCVQLDAHPGVTKCYVQVEGPAADAVKTSMNTYDGELHDLELALASSGTAAAFFDTGDLPVGENLCELFVD